MANPRTLAHEHPDKLYELADLVHALARQLGAPADLRPGPCTPVEINVMRFITKNPGTQARAAASATLLASSNFSRVIKSLLAKGLIRRGSDERDARIVRLYPTEMAISNMERMRDVWSQTLNGTVTDPATLDLVNATLGHIEAELVSRSHKSPRVADSVEGVRPISRRTERTDKDAR